MEISQPLFNWDYKADDDVVEHDPTGEFCIFCGSILEKSESYEDRVQTYDSKCTYCGWFNHLRLWRGMGAGTYNERGFLTSFSSGEDKKTFDELKLKIDAPDFLPSYSQHDTPATEIKTDYKPVQWPTVEDGEPAIIKLFQEAGFDLVIKPKCVLDNEAVYLFRKDEDFKLFYFKQYKSLPFFIENRLEIPPALWGVKTLHNTQYMFLIKNEPILNKRLAFSGSMVAIDFEDGLEMLSILGAYTP